MGTRITHPPLDAILASLRRVSGPDISGWYTALCPFHDDHNPSFRLTAIGFKCHGCQASGPISLLARDLGISVPVDNRLPPSIEATYDYVNERREFLFQVVRFRPKSFRQRTRNSQGDWVWSTKGVRRVLYQLPDILESAHGDTVFVVEGEKDVEALRSLRLVATCNPGGAGKLTEDIAGPLFGRRVAVIADKDEAGRSHANQVAQLLSGRVLSLKVVEVPELG